MIQAQVRRLLFGAGGDGGFLTVAGRIAPPSPLLRGKYRFVADQTSPTQCLDGRCALPDGPQAAQAFSAGGEGEGSPDAKRRVPGSQAG